MDETSGFQAARQASGIGRMVGGTRVETYPEGSAGRATLSDADLWIDPPMVVPAVAIPRASLAPVNASDAVATRRRALFDRIIAMDDAQLAAMERCAGMVEGKH